MAFGNLKRNDNYIERHVYFIEVLVEKKQSGGASSDRKPRMKLRKKLIRREVERRY